MMENRDREQFPVSPFSGKFGGREQWSAPMSETRKSGTLLNALSPRFPQQKLVSLPCWQRFNLIQNFYSFHVLTVMVSSIEDKDQRQPLNRGQSPCFWRSISTTRIAVTRRRCFSFATAPAMKSISWSTAEPIYLPSK